MNLTDNSFDTRRISTARATGATKTATAPRSINEKLDQAIRSAMHA